MKRLIVRLLNVATLILVVLFIYSCAGLGVAPFSPPEPEDMDPDSDDAEERETGRIINEGFDENWIAWLGVKI